MRIAIGVLALLLSAGCGSPVTVDNNVGFVRTALFEDARRVLAEQGIEIVKGQSLGNVTGIRVAGGDSWWAVKILLQWRRGKEPGAYITREEFEQGLENP